MRVQLRDILPDGSLAAFQEKGHIIVYGMTGSGKTYFLRHHHKATHLVSLFVTPHYHASQGRIIRNARDLQRGLKEGHTRFQYKPPGGAGVKRDDVQLELQKLVDVILPIGEGLLQPGENETEPWLLIIIDEVHRYTEKTGVPGPVEILLTEGRKFGVRCLLADQRPARVSLEAPGQSWLLVIFKIRLPDARYLEKQGTPVQEFAAWIEVERQFVLVKEQEWTPCIPLP